MASKTNTMRPHGHSRRLPDLHEKISGPYEAPDGNLYDGFGEVCEKGYAPDGSMYFRVRPIPCSKYEFRNAVTDEPMPKEYYPTARMWEAPKRFSRPPRTREGGRPKRGEEAFGVYITPDLMRYLGVGRVLKVSIKPDYIETGVNSVMLYVQPIPGRHGDKYQFYDFAWQRPMDEINIPSAPYPLDDQQTINGGKKTDKCREFPRVPKLGTEDFGSYTAPNGQWYCGVGRVIQTGVNQRGYVYTYVEPIPGKHGGDYDFFHIITDDWMPQDQLPPNPRNNLTPEVEAGTPLVAPTEQLYLGVGKVMKTGTNENGHIYVDMQPTSGANQGTVPDAGHVYINLEPLENDIPDDTANENE